MSHDEEPPANGPFEGPEKLLEIWFAPSAADCHDAPAPGIPGPDGGKFGLRKVPRAVWEEMLDIVKCKILSVVEGMEMDAYLLRLVIITHMYGQIAPSSSSAVRNLPWWRQIIIQ